MSGFESKFIDEKIVFGCHAAVYIITREPDKYQNCFSVLCTSLKIKTLSEEMGSIWKPCSTDMVCAHITLFRCRAVKHQLFTLFFKLVVEFNMSVS